MQEIYETYNHLTNQYSGKTIEEIMRFLDIFDPIFLFSKGAISLTVKSMIGDINRHLLKQTGKNITTKTIGVTSSGHKKFDCKLFAIDFDEIMDKNIKFENSQFYNYFKNKVFVYAVYEFPNKKIYNQGEFVFSKFKVVDFDDKFINNKVRRIWEQIREIIFTDRLKDVVVLDKDNCPVINPSGTVRSAPNFPKSSEGVLFVRGGGKDATIKPLEINNVKMYTQFIWLKGDYIIERLLYGGEG